ncbi:MAG: radical SAM protein, partial [Deltaproteobacteria bacterium]|nr:radical SAM protein [Deltaproteobacteria bacterium]
MREKKMANRSIRVMLIQPPNHGGVRSLLPQVDEDGVGIGFKPPLGLLYLATYVTRHSSHEVKVIDAPAMGWNLADVVREAAAFRPHLVGISAWTDFWYPAYHLGRQIKRDLPETHLVYGGPHVGIFAGETLDLPFVDSVICGDGEWPFLCLCHLVADGRLADGVPGLHLKSAGVSEGPSRFHVQEDLDALPIPDRRFLPVERYGSVLSRGRVVTTMMTSRGCPYRCTYCKLHFQRPVFRSASSVVEEFRQIARLGIQEVEVYDDTFTWSKTRVEEICRALIAENIQVTWAIRDRVNQADPRLLSLLYQAGCRRVHYGVESGVDRVIQRMGKGITTGQARRAVTWAKAAGMNVLTYFMFGNLDETVDDMRRTIDFALDLDPDYAEFSITIPYPGTELYHEAQDRGLITSDYWRDYAL